jgi:hypothetical protein
MEVATGRVESLSSSIGQSFHDTTQIANDHLVLFEAIANQAVLDGNFTTAQVRYCYLHNISVSSLVTLCC